MLQRHVVALQKEITELKYSLKAAEEEEIRQMSHFSEQLQKTMHTTHLLSSLISQYLEH